MEDLDTPLGRRVRCSRLGGAVTTKGPVQKEASSIERAFRTRTPPLNPPGPAADKLAEIRPGPLSPPPEEGCSCVFRAFFLPFVRARALRVQNRMSYSELFALSSRNPSQLEHRRLRSGIVSGWTVLGSQKVPGGLSLGIDFKFAAVVGRRCRCFRRGAVGDTMHFLVFASRSAPGATRRIFCAGVRFSSGSSNGDSTKR